MHMNPTRLFNSFWLGGFECASHRRNDGKRLDLLAATGHDERAAADYRQLASFGIHTVRDGVRWHLIEKVPGQYDWSSFLPMLRAAADTNTQVIWDLCHYGFPDDIDIWSSAFVERIARFAAATAQLVKDETDTVAMYCPVNEMSYWAWAGGQVGLFNPCDVDRGGELKRQLVRAAIAATEAIREVDPRVRLITAEPLIHVTSLSDKPRHKRDAEAYRLIQYEAVDLLTGRQEPELGGRPEYLDVLGVNYYPFNQWYLGGSTIPLGHHAFRALSEMLQEVYERYRCPLLIAETGAEGSGRASWLHYVGAEVQEALSNDVPIEGICLYPILDYPGWENERVCRVGLLSTPLDDNKRIVCERTAAELIRLERLFRPMMGSREVVSFTG
jgi:beta-glucosidase/6-phospho-beta-glucosidase/beta-galactosidase